MRLEILAPRISAAALAAALRLGTRIIA